MTNMLPLSHEKLANITNIHCRCIINEKALKKYEPQHRLHFLLQCWTLKSGQK